MADEEPGGGPAEDAPPAPAKSGRGRIWGVRAIIVLASILLGLGVLATWIDRVALTSSSYADTSEKLVADPTIRTAVAGYLVDQLYANVDVSAQLEAQLPTQLKPLAGPAAGVLHDYAQRGAEQALASPRGQQLWHDANERASQRMLALVKGEAPHSQITSQGVVLDLRSLLIALTNRVGLGERAAAAIPAGSGQILIIKNDQLSTVQTIVNVLEQMSYWLAIVAVILYGIAIYLAKERRRIAVRGCAVGILLVGLIILISRRGGGGILLDQLNITPAARPAVNNAWDIITEDLRLAAILLVIVGLLGLVWVWLSGEGRRAVSVRRWFAPYARDHAGRVWVIFLALCFLLMLWQPLGAVHRLTGLLLLFLIAVAGFEALRRQSATEFPDAAAVDFAALRGKAASMMPRGRGDDRVDQLAKLKDLHDRGALTDEEYAAEKQRLLG